MKKVLGVIFSVFVLLSVHTQPTGTTPVEAVCTCGVDCNNNFNIYMAMATVGYPFAISSAKEIQGTVMLV
jgi:hypothetical protein